MQSTIKLLIFSVLLNLVVNSTGQVDISSAVNYKDGSWSGSVYCNFEYENDCALSMHVNGRRIGLYEDVTNETIFVSCYTSNTAIALSVTYFNYDNVQDYTCLEDDTMEYKSTWLTGPPHLEVETGNEPGEVAVLTCNSFPGAPLYWILPGSATDNKDVTITNNSNHENSSSIAIITLDENDSFQEYKCCMKLKDGQPGSPLCDSYTLPVQSSVRLLSYYADYSNSYPILTCIFGQYPTPVSSYIEWDECDSSGYCYSISSSYYLTTINSETNTLNTTLNYPSGPYNSYKCYYSGGTSHTFYYDHGSFAPEMSKLENTILYSTDGFAAVIGCSISANPSPTFTWLKTDVFKFANGSETLSTSGKYTIHSNQVSDTEWETYLSIYPYDANEDNALYTCISNNSLGQESLQLNTNLGPDELELNVITVGNITSNDTTGNSTFENDIVENSTSINSTAMSYQGICRFKSFPLQYNYEFNIIKASNVFITNTSLSYDDRLMETLATVDFDIQQSEIYQEWILECKAFDRFSNATESKHVWSYDV